MKETIRATVTFQRKTDLGVSEVEVVVICRRDMPNQEIKKHVKKLFEEHYGESMDGVEFTIVSKES